MRINRSEQTVLEFLHKHLPEEWEIYVQPTINGLRPDFVLLNPDVGIGVVEVKNWSQLRPRYRAAEFEESGNFELHIQANGQWLNAERSNPVSQVLRYRREILDLYCPNLTNGIKVFFGAVIFTRATRREAVDLLRPWLKKAKADQYEESLAVSGIEELAAGNIRAVFPAIQIRKSSDFNPTVAADFRAWLEEPEITRERRSHLDLDTRQNELAHTRTATGYRRICGPAGTGKSLVAVTRAAHLVAENKRVLVLCFNLTLVPYLRELGYRVNGAPRDFHNRAVWLNFHRWLKRICEDAGQMAAYSATWRLFSAGVPKPEAAPPITARAAPFKSDDPEPDRPHVFNPHLLDLVSRVLETSAAQRQLYDAIIIDEGQDFPPAWIAVIRKALAPGGELMLLRDATQDIYGNNIEQTEESYSKCGFRGSWVRLDNCYRIPARLQESLRHFASLYLHDPEDDLPAQVDKQGLLPITDTQTPCELRWRECNVAEDIVSEILAEIRRFIQLRRERIITYPDVVVLVPDSATGLNVCGELKKLKIHHQHTFGDPSKPDDQNDHIKRQQKMAFRLATDRVNVTTIHSFKGIEARALIVVLTTGLHTTDSHLFYTAATRLKATQETSYLTVISNGHDFDSYAKTWDYSYREPTDQEIETALFGDTPLAKPQS
jgi:hypothetical protein